MKFFENNNTQVFALGGLGEIGKNMYCVMHNDELIIIDSGVMFPQDELLGIDYVIPDYTFLKQNSEKIKALIITHGHEDHIGSIPFLLQTMNIPVIYAPKQATELIKKKLEERNIKYKNLNTYTEDLKLKFKYFQIEFFATTHSIPDSHGIAINTPNGLIVMTGDFKFDWTPIGPMSNIHKMAELGKRGVKLLMSDSTNAMVDGVSISESKVDETLNEVFENCEGRIIIATFASNIYRLKHIVETCRKNNRKVALFGRSMDTSIEIAVKGGYIIDDGIFISPEEALKAKENEITLLCTGSQGEPLAALSRIANGSHRQIKLLPNDIVVFSSSAIPGNASAITNTINKLYLKGVKVFTNTSISEIHTSGHGNREELKLMLRLLNPQYLMPYHGEFRMLKAHAQLGVECGLTKENTFVLDNGDILSLSKHTIKKAGNIPASDIYVDGNRIGDIGNAVIKDRIIMSDDGILVIIANIDGNKRELIGNTNITTRGFVLVNESSELLERIEFLANQIIIKNLKNKNLNYTDLKHQIVQEVFPFIKEETGRKPIILPVFMEIKRESN